MSEDNQATTTHPGIGAYKRVDGLGLFLQIALALSVLVAAYVLYADVTYINVVDQILDGTYRGTFDEAVAVEERFLATAWVVLPFYLSVGIVWIIWMFRMYRNVTRAFGRPRQYRVGWAIAGWFVPIWSLFRPRQVMGDIWNGSAASARQRQPWFFNAWWAAWLLISWISQVAVRAQPDAAEDLPGWLRLVTGLDLLMVPAAVLSIIVVRATTQRHEDMARQRATAAF